MILNLKITLYALLGKSKPSFSPIMKRFMEHAANSYFIWSSICCLFAATVPFFNNVDPLYFTIKFIFQKQSSTWWMKTIRSVWAVLIFQRWIIGTTIAALEIALNSILCKKIVTKVVELGKRDNMNGNNNSLEKAIDAYRQLHISITSLNRVSRDFIFYFGDTKLFTKFVKLK